MTKSHEPATVLGWMGKCNAYVSNYGSCPRPAYHCMDNGVLLCNIHYAARLRSKRAREVAEAKYKAEREVDETLAQELANLSIQLDTHITPRYDYYKHRNDETHAVVTLEFLRSLKPFRFD